MSHRRLYALIVSSCDEIRITAALRQALGLGLRCTGVVTSPLNGVRTFMVAPSGAWYGTWADDVSFDRCEMLIEWLHGVGVIDDELPIWWTEVTYADELGSGDTAVGSSASFAERIPAAQRRPFTTPEDGPQ